VTLPTGFIALVGGYLEQLRPDSAKPIVSQYRDVGSRGEISRLCDPDAVNPLLGRILCDHNLGSGAPRGVPYCASGSVIGSPATALNCDSAIVDGMPKPLRCSLGAGGPSVPLPKPD
jgi:hypothetical protein